MLKTLTKDETTLLISGPVGQLEMAVAYQADSPTNGWGIVCHPHSLHGGAMYNKVVATLTKTFQEAGLNTVRFNFRGVGQSQGQFDRGQGELDDLIAVMGWIQDTYKHFDIALAGFSFGAYVVASAATRIPVTKLITVAPPVEHFPMQDLPPISCPWILVQGERDDIVPAEAVLKWAEARAPRPVILRFPEAGHFFHGQLMELRLELLRALA
jgi:alpha/beta superfamily hydrolase